MKFDEGRPLHRVVGNRELPRAKKVGFMGDATHPLRVIMAQPLTIASYAISDELGARKKALDNRR